MSKHIAVNGQEITDAMIERWCEAYERGEFPEGERTVGGVVAGRPPLSLDGTAAITVKMPSGMKAALVRKAESEGMNASAYVRHVLAEDLMAVG